MFTLVGMVTWVDVGGGCYRVVSDHGSDLRLDGWCVLVMHACQLHVCLLHLHFMCLLYFLDVYHEDSKVFMRNLMIDFVKCNFHEYVTGCIWIICHLHVNFMSPTYILVY